MDGLLVQDRNVRIFLRTMQQQLFVLELFGVERLMLEEFREGNIIFDIVVRVGAEIASDDIHTLFGFSDEQGRLRVLEEAQQKGRIVVEIRPSYGASCLLIADSVQLSSRSNSSGAASF